MLKDVERVKNNMPGYEYRLIPEDSYESSNDIANSIVEDTALKYNVPKSEVRYPMVINYLYSIIGTCDTRGAS